MSNISDWAVTAGDNSSAPPNGAPEGMARAAVNDTMREMMAATARDWRDRSGGLVTAGSSNAYTVTTTNNNQALEDIGVLIVRADRDPTDTPTLNVDGLGAKTWRGAAVGEDRLVGAVYNAEDDAFDNPFAEFPSGTRMLFRQTAAPVGWTKSTTHNNKSLRIVSGTVGSGGTTAFTSVFTSRTVAQENLPDVSLDSGPLTITGSPELSGNQGGGLARAFDSSSTGRAAGGNSTVVAVSWADTTLSVNAGTLNVGGSVPLGGSGTAMDFDVQYVDVIEAAKD